MLSLGLAVQPRACWRGGTEEAAAPARPDKVAVVGVAGRGGAGGGAREPRSTYRMPRMSQRPRSKHGFLAEGKPLPRVGSVPVGLPESRDGSKAVALI